MKRFANDMIPGDIFHPSEIIRDEMEAQGVKQADIVNNSQFKRSNVSLVLSGKRGISIPFAIALEKVLSIPAEFWIRLQKNYELSKELVALQKIKNVS